jgi:SIR2-like domain
MRGHLFVVDGNIEKLAVDAWYLPVDRIFNVTNVWADTRSKIAQDIWDERTFDWGQDELARFLAVVDDSDVWLGNVGRKSSVDASHYAECAIHFVTKASEKWRKENPEEPRLPLVAINHLGTGQGGARELHGHVLTHLITALNRELDNGLRADIVLVSWGQIPESAAQFARFKRKSNWREDPQWRFEYEQDRLHDTAQDLAFRICRKSAAIFMGAGVSKGAGLPGWSELLIELGRETRPLTTETDLQAAGDPRDQANLLDRRFKESGQSFTSSLQRRFKTAKYSLQHGLIASLPCEEFITTNVDELFEDACSTAGRSITVMPHAVKSPRWLLKLHGTIKNESSLVFTRDNYLQSIRANRALFGLVQAMLFTRHMIFIGYGLGDEDFHEVVYDVRSAFQQGSDTEVFGTALTLVDDPVKAELWKDVLDIVPMRPAGTPVSEAVRDLERFLDLVGMLASDRFSFILDVQYSGLLDPNEKELAERLHSVADVIVRNGTADHSWQEVRELLERLGFKDHR